MVVAIMRPIRGVIVWHRFVARTLPVALIILLAIMVRHYPHRAFIRRTAPVAGVPLIMASYRIPISANIRIARPRACMPHLDSGRRRRPDVDSDTDLAKHRHAGKQHQAEQFLFHIFLSPVRIVDLTTKLRHGDGQMVPLPRRSGSDDLPTHLLAATELVRVVWFGAPGM